MMETETLLQAIRDSLKAIVNPRFYEDERSFQGQLLIELAGRIGPYLHETGSIVEIEHQKSVKKHKIVLRPDIIIHQPFDPIRHSNRQSGNVAVIALKRRAGPMKAVEDFVHLQRMMNTLHYPIGIFVNVDHPRTQATHAPVFNVEQDVIAFATKLTPNGVQIVEDAV